MAEEKTRDLKNGEEKSQGEADDPNSSTYDSAFTFLATDAGSTASDGRVSQEPKKRDAVDEGSQSGIVPSLISLSEKVPYEYVVRTFVRRVCNRFPRVIPRAYKTKMDKSDGHQEQKFIKFLPEKSTGQKTEFKLKFSVPISITVNIDKVKKRTHIDLGRFGVSHWVIILTTCLCLMTIAVYCGGADRREEADRFEESDHEDADQTEVFVLGPEHGIGYIRLTAGIASQLEVHMRIPE